MKTKKLNRDSNARAALFKGLIAAMIDHEEMTTTTAKAQVIRGKLEKMISQARTGTVHARRLIQAEIQDGNLVAKLFNEIAPRYASVKGGFTKMIVVGTRKGDNAPIVKLSLTKKSTSAATSKTSAKEEKATPTVKKSAKTPKVVAPKLSRPTKAATSGKSNVGMVRKSGER